MVHLRRGVAFGRWVAVTAALAHELTGRALQLQQAATAASEAGASASQSEASEHTSASSSHAEQPRSARSSGDDCMGIGYSQPKQEGARGEVVRGEALGP